MTTYYRPLEEGEVIQEGDVFFFEGNAEQSSYTGQKFYESSLHQVFRPVSGQIVERVPTVVEVRELAYRLMHESMLVKNFEDCVIEATLKLTGLEEPK